MSRFIYRDMERFAVWGRSEPPSEGRALPFGHAQTALPFLRRFRGDLYNMDALREALTQDEPCPCARKYTDEEILRQVAWRLTEGTLHVAERPYDTLPRGAARMGPTPMPASEAPPELLAEPADVPTEPVAEPDDMENVDAAAQAATLENAAETGTPFCEECERARREQEAAMA